MAMDGGTSSKRQVEAETNLAHKHWGQRRPWVQALLNAESSSKRQNVTMGMETLDCPICFHPLRPPIYQCSVGHFVCSSCRPRLLANKCYLCSAETSFERCLGMEQVMQSVTVPCSNAKYGCAQKTTYYQKEEHEKACPNTPCFCPEPSCGFAGPTASLLDHLTSRHKWPATTITCSDKDDKAEFRVQPGLHVLRSEDGHIFLLKMALEPFGHAISVICIQPKATGPKFKCEMYHTNSTTGYSNYLFCNIRSSSLSDGLPTGYNLILPKGEVSDGGEGILLSITIRNTEVKKRSLIRLKSTRDA